VTPREEQTVPAVQRVRESELAHRTQQVLEAVRQGHAVVVERDGQPAAAIIDITDYRLLRALLRAYASAPAAASDAGSGLSDAAVAGVAAPEARDGLVLAHYLAGAISLGRAAELLGLSSLDLRARFQRLDVPLRLAPADAAQARADAATASSWPSTAR
jgi:prevent-host-death family protein